MKAKDNEIVLFLHLLRITINTMTSLDDVPYLTITVPQALTFRPTPTYEPLDYFTIPSLIDYRAHRSGERLAAGFPHFEDVEQNVVWCK